MKVMAFLQNQWVKDPKRVRAAIKHYGEKYRRRFIVFALFAGCQTGRRIKKAFGEMTSEMIWEESSLRIGGRSASSFPADLKHMRSRIKEEEPHLIVSFGKTAGEALKQIIKPEDNIEVVYLPHPAVRNPGIFAILDGAAGHVRMRKAQFIEKDSAQQPEKLVDCITLREGAALRAPGNRHQLRQRSAQ